MKYHCPPLARAYGAQCGLSRSASACADARAIRAPSSSASRSTLPTLNEYCAVAQKEIATSRVPARNVLVTDYQAFSRASPQVKPLETLQFVGYADPQQTRPRMISCKLHSAERIRAEYGATAAGESTTCARLNRRTLDAVMRTLTDRQKKKMPFKGAMPYCSMPDEQAASEAQWLESFTMVADRCRWHIAHSRQEPARRQRQQRVSTRRARAAASTAT